MFNSSPTTYYFTKHIALPSKHLFKIVDEFYRNVIDSKSSLIKKAESATDMRAVSGNMSSELSRNSDTFMNEGSTNTSRFTLYYYY